MKVCLKCGKKDYPDSANTCTKCGESLAHVPPPPPLIKVESLHLDSTVLELYEKQQETLIIIDILPSNATNKTVIWSSNNKQVASVNNGKVTAIKAGKTVITVKSTDGSDKSAECDVTVKKRNNCKVFLTIGALLLLVIAGIVIFVLKDCEGKIPTSNGIITNKIEDNKKTAAGEVPKIEKTTISPASVSLNLSSLSLDVGKSRSLVANISPADATNTDVRWSSSNSAVATVNTQGLVTAVSEGVASITVTTVDGNRTYNCSVNVTPVCDGTTIINYSFGRYEGPVKNCIPEGQGGTMTYTCRIQIAKREEGRVFYAEKGDYFTGKWYNGDIEFGNLYDSTGKQKLQINVGRRPNPYDLRNDRCE